MKATELVDEKYYQAVEPQSTAERLLIAARKRIYRDFLRYCRPKSTQTVLDIGVSDVINDAANMLERRYPYPDRITAVGLGGGEEFRAAFPHTTYVRIEPNHRLPFPDGCFDIAASNAVVEHVGSRPNQLLFVAELLRVARKVFISIPNRYFPVEHHTALPLLHYFDATFTFACRRMGKAEWAEASNLILMSKRNLQALVPAGCEATITNTGLVMGPLSSNLLLFIDQDGTRG